MEAPLFTGCGCRLIRSKHWNLSTNYECIMYVPVCTYVHCMYTDEIFGMDELTCIKLTSLHFSRERNVCAHTPIPVLHTCSFMKHISFVCVCVSLYIS